MHFQEFLPKTKDGSACQCGGGTSLQSQHWVDRRRHSYTVSKTRTGWKRQLGAKNTRDGHRGTWLLWLSLTLTQTHIQMKQLKKKKKPVDIPQPAERSEVLSQNRTTTTKKPHKFLQPAVQGQSPVTWIPSQRKQKQSQIWSHMTLIPGFGRLRQEDEAS